VIPPRFIAYGSCGGTAPMLVPGSGYAPCHRSGADRIWPVATGGMHRGGVHFRGATANGESEDICKTTQGTQLRVRPAGGIA
jgi:hypothetical protein